MNPRRSLIVIALCVVTSLAPPLLAQPAQKPVVRVFFDNGAPSDPFTGCPIRTRTGMRGGPPKGVDTCEGTPRRSDTICAADSTDGNDDVVVTFVAVGNNDFTIEMKETNSPWSINPSTPAREVTATAKAGDLTVGDEFFYTITSSGVGTNCELDPRIVISGSGSNFDQIIARLREAADRLASPALVDRIDDDVAEEIDALSARILELVDGEAVMK